MTPDLATNVLYYGDNLDILRRYLPDAARKTDGTLQAIGPVPEGDT